MTVGVHAMHHLDSMHSDLLGVAHAPYDLDSPESLRGNDIWI